MHREQVVGQLRGTGGPIRFEWEVDFLSLAPEVDECYNSPIFFYGDSSWYIELLPNGQTCNSSEGYVGVYLMRGDWGPPVTVTYRLLVKEAGGREVLVSEKTEKFDEKDCYGGEPECFRRSKVTEEESEFLSSGMFTVICMLKYDEMHAIKADEVLRRAMQDCITTNIKSIQTEPDVDTNMLLSDLKDLFVSGHESDVTVKVKGEEMRLHRAILAARSPVFQCMFKHDMKEKATGVVSVDDFEVGPFRVFVRYLYTGRTVELSQENVLSVYEIAHKYQVEVLKTTCLDIMKGMMCVNTFYDIANLAVTYSEESLLVKATDFLRENAGDIMTTENWLNLLRNNLIPINELAVKAFVRE